MSLKQYVYVSAADHLMSAEELADLLRQSRENNARDGITGMLFYHGGTFMQAFEGPPEQAEGLHARIAADPRHRKIIMLFQGEVSERQFGGWTMGFQTGKEALDAEAGFRNLFGHDVPPELWHAAAGRARQFLLSFRKQMVR